jgi:hypothetical protein
MPEYKATRGTLAKYIRLVNDMAGLKKVKGIEAEGRLLNLGCANGIRAS